MMEPDASSFIEVDLKQEKFEDVKEEGKKYVCGLCDKEMVHRMALVLLEGLSTACVDNTTGDMFKTPGTVASDIRKEMLDYLTERSESYVAETFLSDEGYVEERVEPPSDIISDMIEDFVALKRNMLSRVSGWVLSENREDKIDDFVQEMEMNSFWLLDRREAIAKTLLKNVDFKSEYHCNMKFKSEEELEQHRPCCGFRTVLCENEGCCATFSAAQEEQHDSVCPFKVLPCEQNCSEVLIRREMDRHCITVCPMKRVNCPFYSIGCQANVPSCNIKEHCLNDVRTHLLYALQYLHKGASAEDLAPRADQIEQEILGRLAETQSVRSFTNKVKDADSKLGPLNIVNNSEDTKNFTSKEPPEDKNNSGSEPMQTEDTETTPLVVNKKSDREISETKDANKSDTTPQPSPKAPQASPKAPQASPKAPQASPKGPKKDEPSEEKSPKSDTKHSSEEKSPKSDSKHSAGENMNKSEVELPPAGEVKKMNSEQPLTEGMSEISL